MSLSASTPAATAPPPARRRSPRCSCTGPWNGGSSAGGGESVPAGASRGSQGSYVMDSE